MEATSSWICSRKRASKVQNQHMSYFL